MTFSYLMRMDGRQKHTIINTEMIVSLKNE